MAKLILLRHGESMWNKKNLFTGWVDVPLSPNGIDEALRAGRELASMPIDVIYCSTLVRAMMTAMLVMSAHDEGKTPVVIHEDGKLSDWSTIYSEKAKNETIPVYCSDALNERMYGELQGLNKQETREKHGDEQVKIWRRSFKTCPPNGESLELTTKRTIPYFEEVIIPELQEGKNVLISAHGNSLRACVKDIEGLADDEIVAREIATGVPLFYTYEDGKFVKS